MPEGARRRAQLDPVVVELEAAELEVVGGPTKSVTATGSTLLKCFAMTPCANVSGWKTIVGLSAVAAAVQPGITGRLALLVDKETGVQFLVDSGAVFSVLPYTSSDLPSSPRITTTYKSPIPCWGGCSSGFWPVARGFSGSFCVPR